jgi:DNA-binding LacI/PurR family transcriptional regulator
MNKGPTVYDVARHAGVSIATVSFAFRRPERVKESTRDAVLAAAAELGYVPNVSARGLADGRTGALGLYSYDYLLDTDEPPAAARGEDELRFPLYVDEVQRGVELECWQRGYALMIGGGGAATSGSVVTDIAGRVDGLAVFPQTVPSSVLQRIARRIPVVEVSHPAADDGVDHVTVDNVGGMRALTDHLLTVHRYTRLEFVGAVTSADSAARFEGFRQALVAARLPAPQTQLAPEAGDLDTARVVAEVLQRPDPPQALVCATDLEALQVISALSAAGVDVPDRVAVTGFDGILAGRLSWPTLTTVRQPMEQLGREVVDLLIARLEDLAAPPVHRELPVQLVVRESCGCTPG